ncbi:ABC transporter ATP-binding protein [Rhizobium sp. FY34]|uniref:ABC transporter ATP-binding protein n=1 Tax=Rhizobium sp. FY34 TaxID=2562309 RepID=UPI0010C13E35|nr:ABC transporter ATP-binding protein [Rhizobium sp. FY34]
MLKLDNVSKVYPAGKNEYAGGIRNADFNLEPGTFFTMLGPSGCGKTTTLRCIAGLEEPDKGRILLDGRPIFDGAAGVSVPMHRRNIGMVFQSYAIWPHMSVFENVAFPLKVSKAERYSTAEIDKAVHGALEVVGLGGYGARSATQLSGGQQQRIALARAIVHRPKLLLLDEPLSNLDATLREGMRTELKRLQTELGITAVYVTHDQTEALAMSDVIAVIQKGHVQQFGTPQDIYFRPANEFVAGFIGHTNILRGKSLGGSADAVTVEIGGGVRIRCHADADQRSGETVGVSIRPENIVLAGGHEVANENNNRLIGRVGSVSFLGNVLHYVVTVGDQAMQVESNPDRRFEPGSEVALSFAPRHGRVLPVA